MTLSNPHTRRAFVRDSAIALAALGGASHALGAKSTSPARFPIIGFSKPFQDAGFDRTADIVAEIGWDGIECPLRPRGQILPEHAADELPRLIEALAKRGKTIGILTLGITSMEDPHAETILRAASKAGVRRLRLGTNKYDERRHPQKQLDELAPRMRDLAAACRELDLHAGIQNHSGWAYVGAPIWDIYQLVRDVDRQHLGTCFDIGHATIEGGLSWPIEARLMEPYFAAVYVKDFTWKKNENGGWRAEWGPLGDGMVDHAFFDWLKQTAYAGPISQHHEYEVGDHREMIAHMQRDLKVLREWLG